MFRVGGQDAYADSISHVDEHDDVNDRRKAAASSTKASTDGGKRPKKVNRARLR